jgi:hypothetical protein
LFSANLILGGDRTFSDSMTSCKYSPGNLIYESSPIAS